MSQPLIVDLLTEFVRDVRSEELSEETIDRYLRLLDAFARWLDVAATIDDIQEELLMEYHAELVVLEQAPRTRALTLSAIRKFCRWCVKTKRRKDDPTILITWPKLPKLLPKALDGTTLQLLHSTLATPKLGRGRPLRMWRRNVRAIYLMLYGGLRRGEAANQVWEDIDLVNGVLLVRNGKGAKDRAVPLHPALWDELERVSIKRRKGPVVDNHGRAVNGHTIAHICDRWLVGLGIEGITPHSLRHTFATEMRRAGGDLKDVQDALGHESLATTEGYLGPDPERLRQSINRIPGPDQMGRRTPAQVTPRERLRIVG